MKRAISTTVIAALAAMFAAAALAAPAVNNTLVISHIVKGCHIWSLNGAKPAVNQLIKLHAGQSFTIKNTDVMPHRLIKLSGPPAKIKLVSAGMTGKSTGMMKAPYAAGMMPHMSSVMRVTLPTAGVYAFETKPGEDYFAGVKTTGEDNVLKVRVVVG